MRAGFIAFHLIAITVMAMPAPGGAMSRSAWRDPTVQAEFRAWATRIQALGIDMTSDQLEQRAWDFSSGFMEKRTQVLEPFGPYYKYAGTKQSWRMFVAPHRFPARLEFRIREHGEWRTVYQARSKTEDWRAYQLDHDRMRSAIFRYGWAHHRRHYVVFSEYYARQAFDDFPEADAFQSRFYKYRTLSPEEARSGMDPDGEFINVRVVER